MKKSLTAALLALVILFGLTGCGTYEVRFEPNGGTKVSGELLQEVKKGGDAEPPLVEREGYLFSGWDHDPTNITSDMVIAANWEKLFTITFDPDGGTVQSGEVVQNLKNGAQPTPPTLVKEEMQFQSWSPEVTAVNGDATYKAQWAEIEFGAKEIYQKVGPSVVEITIYNEDGNPESLGSGFFIDDEGTVLTNYHVVEGAYSAKVSLNSGRTYDVKAVLDYNKELDLALLETDVSHSEAVKFASEAPETGDKVYAIGSSKGQTGTLSEGIVSTASRRFADVDVDYIQHNAPISSGNSGGPLVNAHGKVMGVNSMSLKDAQNMNYAINIQELNKLNANNRVNMTEFYQTTNADYLWKKRVKEFIEPAKSVEKESNDEWIQSDELTLGEWTAGAISDESDVDCFYVSIDSPRRVTFELAPNHTNEAKELIALVGLYTGDNDVDALGLLEEVGSGSGYTYRVEKVFELDAPEAGLYCIGITHDDDYEITEPYVYLVRAN